MFYSPKKDIQRYVSIKNRQISDLKKTLETQMVCQADVQQLKKRLSTINSQRNVLTCQNNHNLIKTLQSYQSKISFLNQQQAINKKHLSLKQQQCNELKDSKQQIINKINQTKQRILELRKKKQAVLNGRIQVDNRVLFMVQGNQTIRQQNREMQVHQNNKTKSLTQRQQQLQHSSNQLQSLSKMINDMGNKILVQKDCVRQLKATTDIQQMKIQNKQLKVKCLVQQKSSLLQQREVIKLKKLHSKQRSQLLCHQISSNMVVQQVLSLSCSISIQKQNQSQHLQTQLNQKQIQTQLTQCIKSQLSQMIIHEKQKINESQKKMKDIKKQMRNVKVTDDDIVMDFVGRSNLKQQGIVFKVRDGNVGQTANNQNQITNKLNQTISKTNRTITKTNLTAKANQNTTKTNQNEITTKLDYALQY